MNNYLNSSRPLFAFNIWDINSAKAVMDAAISKKQNIILQTSSNIYKTSDNKQLRKFISSYSEDNGLKVWLHLDHCRDIEIIKNAVENGWDSVMIDVSDKDISENILTTNFVAEFAHKKDILVEAEVGQIRGIEDDIAVRNSAIACKENIDRFLKESRIDMIAVAFGNAHGIYQGEPELRLDLVEYTTKKAEIPFVVHGGSGLKDSVLRKLLSIPGVKKINISTDVKLAYREGILKAQRCGLLEKEGFQASQIEECIHDEIVKMVCSKLDLIPK